MVLWPFDSSLENRKEGCLKANSTSQSLCHSFWNPSFSLFASRTRKFMNVDLAAIDQNQFFPLVAFSSSIFPLFFSKIKSKNAEGIERRERKTRHINTDPARGFGEDTGTCFLCQFQCLSVCSVSVQAYNSCFLLVSDVFVEAGRSRMGGLCGEGPIIYITFQI